MPNTKALRQRAGHPSFQLIVTMIAAQVLLTRGSGRPVLEAQGSACDVVCENAKLGNPPSERDITVPAIRTFQRSATDISVNRHNTVNFKI